MKAKEHPGFSGIVTLKYHPSKKVRSVPS